MKPEPRRIIECPHGPPHIDRAGNRYACPICRAELRYRGRPSIYPDEWDDDARAIPLYVVYNNLTAVRIDLNTRMTMETRQQADLVFDRLLRDKIGNRKIDDKRRFFQALFHAGKLALYYRGCIRYSRDDHAPGFVINAAVIDAAIESGLFHPVTSPKGSPKMSRLLALSPFEEFASIDPWTFDPHRRRKLVFLRKRKSRNPDTGEREPAKDLPFDRRHPVAAEAQRALERCNDFISRYEITYQYLDEWDTGPRGRRQLRPVHYAVFTDTFEFNGRLHTGKYGHQSLTARERGSIQFNGEPCVELDYAAMHCRLLYHRRGLPFENDPYILGEFGYDDRERYLAKTVINAAINAKDSRSAISACNDKRKIFTKGKKGPDGKRERGEMKTGKSLAKARKLSQALEQTGTTFKEIYRLALKCHRPIRDDFSSDAGMQLMRIDSRIALKIFSHFTEHKIPCLCCHDSFLVPRSAELQLRAAMRDIYFAEIGFLPVIR